MLLADQLLISSSPCELRLKADWHAKLEFADQFLSAFSPLGYKIAEGVPKALLLSDHCI